MRKAYVVAVGLAVLIAVAAVIALALTQSGTASPIVRIEPVNAAKLPINSTFTVNVTVEKCTAILAIQIDIRYNPQVLNATNIIGSPFLESTGSSTFVAKNESEPSTNDTSVARIFFAAAKEASTTDPSGDGVLLTITFHVISNGSTQLQLSPVNEDGTQGTYLMSREYTEIIPTLYSGSYS